MDRAREDASAVKPMTSSPENSDWTALGQRLLAHAEAYLERSQSSADPVAQVRAPRAFMESWGLPEKLRAPDGIGIDGVVQLIEDYWQASTRVHDPRCMGHQVAVPHPASALGDFAHGLTNNGYGTYEMGPQGAAVEMAVVDWMLEKIGWSGGSGLLVHGGSLANLSSLLAARATAFPEAWEKGTPPGTKLFVPATSHYSVARCAGILGMGTDAVVTVPADARGVMIPAELDAALAAARAADTPILAVVANACATATGLYDPLRAVGEICRRHGVWLHIDGCHGASVLISEKWKHLVDGIELGDSVCWDAHKMLGSSSLSAGVLFREPDAVYRSFRQDGNYLAGTEAEETPYLRSIECTKSGLGLRAFLVLAMRGEAGLAADLDVMHENARYLNRLLRAADDFEVPLDPESNILLFRPHPGGTELSDTQVEAVRRGLMDSGSYYLTAANFDGRKWLRVTLMNPATSHAHLREMVEEVRQKALAIVAESAVEDALP